MTVDAGRNMTKSRGVVVLWLVVTTTALTAMTLRLIGIVRGDTLDFVVGLVGLAVTFSSLGALILVRRPGHRFGLLLLVLGCIETVNVVMRLVATSMDPASTAAGVLALVEEPLRIYGLFGVGVLILIFPDGHFLSRRWRLVVAPFFLIATLGAVGGMLVPGRMDGIPPVINPIATAATGRIAKILEPAGGLAGIVFLLALGSLVIRYLRAKERERQQIKIFALSVITVVVLIVGTTAALPKQMDNGLLGSLVWQTPWLLPPAAAAYAILRHGLFDIDRVISRTVSYAIVTALLAGAFAIVVLLPTGLVGSQDGRTPSWLIALATLVVAVLFQPLRRRIQRGVDHRFNRARYDAATTIDAFASRLRDEIDMDTLTSELRTVVMTTMHPEHVGLWVAARGRS